MGEQKRKPRPVKLTCGCTRYFVIAPEPGDFVICGNCKTDEQVEPVNGQYAETIVGDVKVIPKKWGDRIVYHGECLICGDQSVPKWKFDDALKTTEIHQYRRHTNHGATLVIEKGERPPPGSPAPF